MLETTPRCHVTQHPCRHVILFTGGCLACLSLSHASPGFQVVSTRIKQPSAQCPQAKQPGQQQTASLQGQNAPSRTADRQTNNPTRIQRLYPPHNPPPNERTNERTNYHHSHSPFILPYAPAQWCRCCPTNDNNTSQTKHRTIQPSNHPTIQ